VRSELHHVLAVLEGGRLGALDSQVGAAAQRAEGLFVESRLMVDVVTSAAGGSCQQVVSNDPARRPVSPDRALSRIPTQQG